MRGKRCAGILATNATGEQKLGWLKLKRNCTGTPGNIELLVPKHYQPQSKNNDEKRHSSSPTPRTDAATTTKQIHVYLLNLKP